MESLSAKILETVFEKNIPSIFSEMINLETCDRYLNDFKLVAVLNWHKRKPARITWSAQGEEEYWMEQILPLLSSSHQESLISAAPQCRKVLDSSGEEHYLFLDDLHLEEGNIITKIYGPTEEDAFIVYKRESALTPKPPPKILFSPIFLATISCGGMWAERVRDNGEFQSLLWISESRWRENSKETQALIDRFEPPEIWCKLCALLRDNGGVAYPDVVEFYGDGTIELSVAFLLPSGRYS